LTTSAAGRVEAVDIAGDSAGPVLAVDDLAVEFSTSQGWARVVDGVSFQLVRGETLALVGESGSGKSVTSLAVMGLLPARVARVSAGRVRLDGIDLLTLPARQLEDIRGERIAMVFQEPMTSLNPAFTVGDQIAETVRRHHRVSRKQARARAVEVLDLVGIPQAVRRLDDYPHEFSGGMRQRVMIAMAVSCEPDVLIADEPTTALDVTIQAQVLDLLRSMRDELGMALLFITHDLGVVADIADRVMVMYAGQAVETCDVTRLYLRRAHPYTEALFRSMPQVGARSERLSSIPGSPPLPGFMPAGCRFAPRCEHRAARCDEGPVPDHRARCVRVHELGAVRR
jgi:peptide/nickel transport system ATP-binding protein